MNRGWVPDRRHVAGWALGLAMLLGDGAQAGTDLEERFVALSERVQELERRDAQHLDRIADLEAQLFETEVADGGRTRVHAFDAVDLTLGGFLTQTLSVADGADGGGYSPNQTALEILLSADLGDRVSLFTALGFLREADVDLSNRSRPRFRPTQNRVPQIIAWFNYKHSDALQFRLGRFVSPHGIINIEHFPPSLLEIQQPQFLRPFPGSTLFPNFMNGVEVHGRHAAGAGAFEYSAYVGSFNAAPEERLSGGRLAYAWEETGITIGANYSHGRRAAGGGPLGSLAIVPALSSGSNEYDLAGLDVLIDRGPLLWKTEFFRTWERGADDRLAFYSQPAWRLSDRWTVFYRFDHLDAGQNLPARVEHVVGLIFDPSSRIRLRGALFRSDQHGRSDELTFGQLSATVSF